MAIHNLSLSSRLRPTFQFSRNSCRECYCEFFIIFYLFQHHRRSHAAWAAESPARRRVRARVSIQSSLMTPQDACGAIGARGSRCKPRPTGRNTPRNTSYCLLESTPMLESSNKLVRSRGAPTCFFDNLLKTLKLRACFWTYSSLAPFRAIFWLFSSVLHFSSSRFLISPLEYWRQELV